MNSPPFLPYTKQPKHVCNSYKMLHTGQLSKFYKFATILGKHENSCILAKCFIRYGWPDYFPPTRILKNKKITSLLGFSKQHHPATLLSLPGIQSFLPLNHQTAFFFWNKWRSWVLSNVDKTISASLGWWEAVNTLIQDALSIKCIMSTHTLSTTAQCVQGGLSSQGLQDDFWFCSPRNG